MADYRNADDRHGLTVDPPPRPSHKDIQGSGNPIPLSPQWLISKAADSKESDSIHDNNKTDALKAAVTVDGFSSAGKKKDAFRSVLHDSEGGRRDRWHDEERETNSAIRRDRWREGDKEPGDIRRMERWLEHSSKHSGEVRRAPSDRWVDSGNKEIDLRRDSKWSTRWGPSDKESDNWREKSLDSSKGSNTNPDKGSPYFNSHGKDMNNHGKETEGDDHYSRSWRSNYGLGRGRGDSSHNQLHTPLKQPNMQGYSRGRAENGISSMFAGRGRFISSANNRNSDTSCVHLVGSFYERSDDTSVDLSSLRYTRIKMLDIYRKTDIKSIISSFDEFVEVPPLTQVETLEPIAFSAPTADESVIIKGIDKGDIVSSGAQLSKEFSIGRSTQEAIPSRQSKLDNYKDQIDNSEVENCVLLESPPYDKQQYQNTSLTRSRSKDLNVITPDADEIISKERIRLVTASPCVPQRSQSTGDYKPGSVHDKDVFSSEVALECMPPSHLQKDIEFKHGPAITSAFYCNTDGIALYSDAKNEAYMKKQLSEVTKEAHPFFSKDVLAARDVQLTSPENLLLYYKDPQGQIQGPFSGGDVIGWFEAGYFGIDLQVRLAGSPADAPFSSLGDVMPHLRAKAGPPPGFGVVKHVSAIGETLKAKFAGPSSILNGLGEYDVLTNGKKDSNIVATEAQNRFLESLMSGNISSSTSETLSFSRGMQESGGTSNRLPPVVGESGNDTNYLLAQTRLLERQRSLVNPVSFLSGGDPSSVPGSKTDLISESVPQPKLFPSVVDSSDQILKPQKIDLLSLLHVGADKSISLSGGHSLPSLSNFSDVATVNNILHAGAELPPEVLSMHYNQHLPSQIRFGGQQQGFQPPNQPSLPNLISQHSDSTFVPPDNFFPSEMHRDLRLQSLAQQHYLLSQFHLPSQVPSAQLPVLEKLLMLQQQQQQEQQLLMQHQQQHHQQYQQMLSKAVSGHQSQQQYIDSSYGQTSVAMPIGKIAMDHVMLHRGNEHFQIGQQLPVAYEGSGRASYYSDTNLQNSLDVGSLNSGPLSMPIPLQIIDQTITSKELDTQFVMDNVANLPDTKTKPEMIDGLNFSEAQGGSEELGFESLNITQSLSGAEKEQEVALVSQAQELAPLGLEDSQLSADVVPPVTDLSPDVNNSFPEFNDQNNDQSVPNKTVETQERKKSSEKKSKKQKKSKTKIILDAVKELSNLVSSQTSHVDAEVVDANANEAKSESLNDISIAVTTEMSESQSSPVPSHANPVVSGPKDEEVNASAIATLASNPRVSSTQWAWKSAPGFKPKSLLEIQQEEQMKAQRGTGSETVAVTPAMVVPSPASWSSITNLENKPLRDTVLASNTLFINSEDPLKSKSRKSNLHDLLAEEVLAKSNIDVESSASNAQNSLLSLPSQGQAHVDAAAIDDNDFVEAKDTRKARKKASKSKAAGAKIQRPVSSAELSASPSTIEKDKITRQVQGKESLLAPPAAAPSLGDFVLWKEDQSSSVPPLAWSMDSKKQQRPMSLRDIQMEQQKRSGTMQQQQAPMPTAKVQPNYASRESETWQVSGSSVSNTASSVQLVSQVSNQTKSRAEDDLFWGLPEQSKAELKKSDFPPTEISVSRAAKGSSLKGVSAAGTGQKLVGGRGMEYSLSSSGPSLPSSKGRGISATKNSEALEFQDWCVNEWIRLTGTNDTSFLEFCIKQSMSEAKMLLRENLDSLDRNHDFIDKFLNYKEFLPSDVLETAFQLQKSHPICVENTGHQNPKAAAVPDADEGLDEAVEGQPKGRGKKKGKKGHKVSSALLGFNVVSNRIMMGEIQSFED